MKSKADFAALVLGFAGLAICVWGIWELHTSNSHAEAFFEKVNENMIITNMEEHFDG